MMHVEEFLRIFILEKVLFVIQFGFFYFTSDSKICTKNKLKYAFKRESNQK